ncbi:protein S40-4-like [Salvia miltiorrhiza]|uniref:protein S40-4-like n=1 Tax=Salvia miltiorrhiza TaxID=226208 RepID=UPI0025AD010E|nr:protein S40-4-like [Salvia miltiorrhiza]
MAAAKSHRYLGGAARLSSADQFEFDEADVWNNNDQTETRKSISNSPRPLRKPLRKTADAPIGAKSLPVNIPDWSKILRGECRGRAGDEDADDEENERMPPHEYLARTRVASLSVHEGIGRTLKGRDLSSLRNAIWKQTGFED